MKIFLRGMCLIYNLVEIVKEILTTEKEDNDLMRVVSNEMHKK